MKIALVRKKYTAYGGAERYIDSLLKHLLELGHEVHIYASQWESPNSSLQGYGDRLVFHRVPMIKGLSVLKVLSFAVNARRLLKKERFDVIHSLERTIYHDIYRAGDGCHKEWLIQRAKYEPPWKTFLVRINPLHWAFLWIEREIFKQGNTEMVIANSQRGKEEINRHYGFPQDRIRVIYNGVDNTRFHPQNRDRFQKTMREKLGFSEHDRILLFLGSGFERKGLKFAIAAVAKMNDPAVKLVVAGRDDPRRYRRLAARLGLAGNVVFVGPTGEPEKLYAAADLFVLPTVYEPFSNACLEALVSGVPVVTTRINGASEFIEEGVTGAGVDDPSNTESLKEAIEGLLAKGDEEPRRWSEKRWHTIGIERHVQETIECYRSLVTEDNEDKSSG